MWAVKHHLVVTLVSGLAFYGLVIAAGLWLGIVLRKIYPPK